MIHEQGMKVKKSIDFFEKIGYNGCKLFFIVLTNWRDTSDD
jgi:hypothetical protein